jgi:hypothetical protein
MSCWPAFICANGGQPGAGALANAENQRIKLMQEEVKARAKRNQQPVKDGGAAVYSGYRSHIKVRDSNFITNTVCQQNLLEFGSLLSRLLYSITNVCDTTRRRVMEVQY